MSGFNLVIDSSLPNQELFKWLFGLMIQSLPLEQVSVQDSGTSSASATPVIIKAENLNSHLAHRIPDPGLLFLKEIPVNEKGFFVYEGKTDYLLTAFYLVNSLQEYQAEAKDEVGRYPYSQSFQHKYGCVTDNLVRSLFHEFLSENFGFILAQQKDQRSSFFLSHDIDSVYGALYQDGLYALKKGRVDVLLKLLCHVVIQKPDWLNMDQIVSLESEYGVKSTFFWLVNKGRINERMVNADYDIAGATMKKQLDRIEAHGFENGLHKSISEDSYDREIEKLGRPTQINRNHYLRLSLPEHYDLIEASGLKVDCSLGFAEHYGFRNSLAIPFRPFDLVHQKPYGFLEVPLTVMDGTFQRYMKLSPEESSERIIAFLEKHKYNALISVLWHNHFFNSYKFGGNLKPYITILKYMKESNLRSVGEQELLHLFYH